MPKTRARKRGKDKNNSTQERRTLSAQAEMHTSGAGKRSRAKAPPSRNTQNFILATMMALGCWGLTISFIFFYPDPNHYLYGGMVACIAVIWSFLVGMRIRKALQQQ